MRAFPPLTGHLGKPRLLRTRATGLAAYNAQRSISGHEGTHSSHGENLVNFNKITTTNATNVLIILNI